MKCIFAILFYILIFQADLFSQEKSKFSTLEYDSVLIYDFNSFNTRIEDYSIIDTGGRLAGSVGKSAKLNLKQSKEFTERLDKKQSFGGGTAACFDPHLGVVYYKEGTSIAHLSICLDCNRIESNYDLPQKYQGKQTADNGEIWYMYQGMNKGFRKFLDKLLAEYNFSHRIKKGSIFDK